MPYLLIQAEPLPTIRRFLLRLILCPINMLLHCHRLIRLAFRHFLKLFLRLNNHSVFMQLFGCLFWVAFRVHIYDMNQSYFGQFVDLQVLTMVPRIPLPKDLST